MGTTPDDFAKRAMDDLKPKKPANNSLGKSLVSTPHSYGIKTIANANWNFTGTGGGGFTSGGNSLGSLQLGQILTVDGGGFTSISLPSKEHTDLGVCQESYDKGYEDGVKAAQSKEGDTRIK